MDNNSIDMASSNHDASEYIKDALEKLVGRLQNLTVIVEKLHQQNVFNGNEVSEIEAEPEKYNKTRKILDLVLNKGEKACSNFLRILDRERKLVLPKPDSTSQTPDLHTWISLFSFRDEAEDDYIKGPLSCHQLQNLLKTRGKLVLSQQWSQSLWFNEDEVHKFVFIPLVLDTETEKNTPRNKITLSKKSKKSRSKKLKSYIPKDTQRKSPEDLLNSSEKSILIVGKPGIGKTTVVQQMLHHWAERSDRNLDFMFFFDENTLSNISTTESLENLLLNTYLMLNPELKENAEEIMQYVQEYSDSVTIVFDGIRDFHKNTVLLEIMNHELLPEAKIVATCRPEVECEFSDWTTCKVYVKGFSEESISDFFRKMSDNEPELVNIVINNPALFSLCHVPMYAFMVAACISYYTSEEAQKLFTATELYVQIFRHCLQRQGNKKLLDLDGHIKHCRDMVLSLAESAFNATKLKTSNLEFDYDERGISGAFLKTVSAVSRARISCAFLHNTTQEFFCALWLLEKSEILDEVLYLCQNEDSEHMKHIIPFLCGLQSRTIVDHLKCLFPLNKVKDNIDGFFEKVLNTFTVEQPNEENTDFAFICQCLYEFQSPETCRSFLERKNYHLDLSEEHLDPYTCCAVSYVIRQPKYTWVHLDLENSAVSLSGLKIILKYSHHLSDVAKTLSQIWRFALKCEELNYLIKLLQLCDNKVYISMSSPRDVLEQAGKIITQYAKQPNLHLHCDKDPQQLTDLILSTVFSWLPHIDSLKFCITDGEKQKTWRKFQLDLCLQIAIHQPQNIQKTLQKVIPGWCLYDETEFLLDLFSHVKQYESKTHRSVFPALLPVYKSVPVWSINLSERKVSVLIDVLKLRTQKKPVKLEDWSEEESEVRSFLQCLPYISELTFEPWVRAKCRAVEMASFVERFGQFYITDSEKNKTWRKFPLDLCLQTAVHQPQNFQETVQKVMKGIEGNNYDYYNNSPNEFLLDLFSHVKQYESKTHRSVLPVLRPVYKSVPVWPINLSERKVSVLLEVLKLQTRKKPVQLEDCSDEESEVRSFLQCLPYISQLRFCVIISVSASIQFIMNLIIAAVDCQSDKGESFAELLVSVCSYNTFPFGNELHEFLGTRSAFLLDLFSHVKQYESKTHRSVFPELLPVYQSLPVWSINLSERKASVLLEVLKLQTQKKPVELRDCSDEESEVRSLLQCLPYISQLRFRDCQYLYQKHAEFLMNLLHHATESDRHTGGNSLELLASLCNHTYFPYGEDSTFYKMEFLLDLISHVKQYESKTHRSVLPALLPVYQSLPVWSINLLERKVSVLLEVLKLQTQKIPVQLEDCSDKESEVRSFLQCLPYISQLSFFVRYSWKQKNTEFLMNLLHHTTESDRHTGGKSLELLASLCNHTSFPYGKNSIIDNSEFLLDLFSHVKQYESKTHRSVIHALLPIYQSLPVWSINLSKRKASVLLEVLKLQTQKKTVELRYCSDEESEVRSFLQCLPYISQLSFKTHFSQKHKHAEFLMNLLHHTTESDRHTGGKSLELLASLCNHTSFPYEENSIIDNSKFLLDLFSHVKQYESKTHRSVLPALLPVYQSLPVWYINLAERNVSVLLEVLKLQTQKKPVELKDCSDEESEVKSFLQCLPYISQLIFKDCNYQNHKHAEFLMNLLHHTTESDRHTGGNSLELLASVCNHTSFPYGERSTFYNSEFLLDLFSHVKQYESKTHRSVLPAFLPIYQSLPVWYINLSKIKVSVLLEVLKLQTQKKPVHLIDCSDEESEVRSFLQCLPYISQLRFRVTYFEDKEDAMMWRKFRLDLCLHTVIHQPQNIQETVENVMTELEEYDKHKNYYYYEKKSEFLLDLISHVKQYESKTHRSVFPALLPVYQSLPVWSINLSERKVSVLLEVLKLQTQKKPVHLIDCSGEESEVRSLLQCLPYISQLRICVCEENSWLIPSLSKAVVDHAEDTELVKAFFAAMDFVLIIDWAVTTRECRAVRKLLNLSDSRLRLTLKPRAISLRGARLLLRHITHLQKLCLSERVVVKMAGAVRAGGSFRSSESRWVIQELCLDFNIINPKIFRFLSSLSSLLNLWTVHCVNLNECRMEAHSLLSLMCHPGLLNIRLSKSTFQQFTDLLYEAQDGELTRFFLEKVGGDLTSCSLSWEKLIYFLQQQVCCISVNIRKNKITHKHTKEILPLLSEIQFKRLKPGDLLSIIREIYETDAAHYVSSLLKSTHNCINLNNTDLDSYHCTALCFTLQHCTSVSLSLMWTSIPDGGLVKILPLFNRLSQLSVDRFLLLKLLHCCSIYELQQGAAAAVFSALKNRLDFSYSSDLDLSTETQDKTLHLSTEDCKDIGTAIQKSQQRTELILEDCELEDTGVDVFLLILHTVTLRCSKSLLLRFLDLLRVVNQSDCVMNAMSLSKALNGDMDLSKTPLDLHACRSLALFLEFSEGLSELDLSHCKLTDQGLELLLPHLHKVEVLDLSHNDIDDCLAGRIYTAVSTSSNIQTVRLFNNRITDKETFQKDKRFEIW